MFKNLSIFFFEEFFFQIFWKEEIISRILFHFNFWCSVTRPNFIMAELLKNLFLSELCSKNKSLWPNYYLFYRNYKFWWPNFFCSWPNFSSSWPKFLTSSLLRETFTPPPQKWTSIGNHWNGWCHIGEDKFTMLSRCDVLMNYKSVK
jgi:hypothetical protein